MPHDYQQAIKFCRQLMGTYEREFGRMGCDEGYFQALMQNGVSLLAPVLAFIYDMDTNVIVDDVAGALAHQA